MRLKPLLAAAAVLLALGPALAHRPRARRAGSGVSPLHVRGAPHVHTGDSADGTGNVEGVARAARRAGLDFVVITDHNTQPAAAREGYRDGVLVLIGMEKSTEHGHALVVGTGPLPFRLDGEVATIASDVAGLGGFVMAAHPAAGTDHDGWSGGFEGLAGLEVVNLADRSVWPRGAHAVLPLVHATWDPRGALLDAFRYSHAPLAVWDRLLADRPAAGVLGSDAHGGIRHGRLVVPFPSHRLIFSLASQHLLLAQPRTGRADADRALVLDALRRGQGWVAFDGLADASAFRLRALSGADQGTVGDAVPWHGAAEITADAGVDGATLLLLRDGREVARGASIRYSAQAPGVYRVEAYLPSHPELPWILSNPLYLLEPDVLARRAALARKLPVEDALPATSTPNVAALDRFEGDGAALSPSWQIDRSADARASARLERGELRFDYELSPTAATHASVCLWGPRNLTGVSSLVFRVRADRTVRFDVQVRTSDPAPPGVRIWRRSVRADPDWRAVSVPLAGLRSYDRRGGRPDLARVVGIYFHVDEANVPPGQGGTVWLDDVGLAQAGR